MTDQIKLPTWFWVISIIALIWNAMGLFAFLGDVFMSDEKLAAMEEGLRNLYETNPTWSKIAYGFATIGGFLGSLLLVLKKKLAHPVLLLSLLGIVVQMSHSLFIADSTDVYGPGAIIMPIMVLLVGIGLVWFARHATNKGWIK